MLKSLLTVSKYLDYIYMTQRFIVQGWHVITESRPGKLIPHPDGH